MIVALCDVRGSFCASEFEARRGDLEPKTIRRSDITYATFRKSLLNLYRDILEFTLVISTGFSETSSNGMIRWRIWRVSRNVSQQSSTPVSEVLVRQKGDY